MQETAHAQQRVASLQMSVSRHLGLVNGLMTMLDRLTAAARTLAVERDALREELQAHGGAAEELLRTRALLEETQRRLEVAEQLQAQTSRRLDDVLRQRARDAFPGSGARRAGAWACQRGVTSNGSRPHRALTGLVDDRRANVWMEITGRGDCQRRLKIRPTLTMTSAPV